MGLWSSILSMFGQQGSQSGQPVEVQDDDLPDDKQAFRLLAMEAARSAGITDVKIAEDDPFAITFGEDGGMKLFLHNLFDETRDWDDEDKRKKLRVLCAQIMAPDDGPKSLDEAATALFPVLRAATFAINMEGAHKLLTRPWQPFVNEGLVIDQDESMRFVTLEQATAWGASAERIFELSRQRLSDVVGGETWVPFNGDPVVKKLDSQDSYEASRLLSVDWVRAQDQESGSRQVYAIPERSTLLAAPENDIEALGRLVKMTREIYESAARSLSGGLYVLGDRDKLEPLVLDREHPLHQELRMLGFVHGTIEYSLQKQQLDKQNEREGVDVFVASYTAVEKNDKSFSYAVWARDADTLLPRAELIVMMVDQNGDDHFAVPWTALHQVCGSLLHAQEGVQPPRWRTLAWPDDEQLARLRGLAVEV